MDGYVNGKTEFKGAIRDLLVLLKYRYDEDNIHLYFINNQIYKPIEQIKGKQNAIVTSEIDLANFAQDIELRWRKGQEKKSWQSTNLNKIFRMILEKTDHNTISILFSDCIYSIHGSTNTIGLLQDEKSLTKDAFLTKWKNDKVPLATTIVKMKSAFNGRYYPYTGDQNGYNIKRERPYYICVFAETNALKDFNKNIELKSGTIEGFENKYSLMPDETDEAYYSVLQSTENRGRFKVDRKNSTANYIHGITDIGLGRNGENLQFAVAVDYSNLQVENDYLIDTENYTVSTNNFFVKEVLPIDSVNIRANDRNLISQSNTTHLIILEAKTRLVSDVSFALKKQIPDWITLSSTENDVSEEITNGKTFGLSYWVTGIAEAYQTIFPEDKNFFECTISIEQ
jgi:hypothetical protein